MIDFGEVFISIYVAKLIFSPTHQIIITPIHYSRIPMDYDYTNINYFFMLLYVAASWYNSSTRS